MEYYVKFNLRTLTTQTASECEVLGLDGNPLSVDSSQVSVLEEGDQVSLAGLLQRQDGRRLEAEVGLEILSDFTDKALEGQLPDEELSRFLVATDLAKSNCSWAETVRLLHTSGSGCGSLAGGLGSELLAGSFTSSGLSSSLLQIDKMCSRGR
jgi:hypothetical protein